MLCDQNTSFSMRCSTSWEWATGPRGSGPSPAALGHSGREVRGAAGSGRVAPQDDHPDKARVPMRKTQRSREFKEGREEIYPKESGKAIKGRDSTESFPKWKWNGGASSKANSAREDAMAEGAGATLGDTFWAPGRVGSTEPGRRCERCRKEGGPIQQCRYPGGAPGPQGLGTVAKLDARPITP